MILGTKEAYGDIYDDLRRIAPTVMSEGDDWKLNLRLHGEALGRTNDAEKLLIDWDNRVAKVRKAIADTAIGRGARPTTPNAFGREHPRRRSASSPGRKRDASHAHQAGARMVRRRPAGGPRGARRPGARCL